MAAKCFDSDDDVAETKIPSLTTAATQGARSNRAAAAPAAVPTRPSALYDSDEETPEGAPSGASQQQQTSQAAPLAGRPAVPQFKRSEWQPPPSQIPITTTAATPSSSFAAQSGEQSGQQNAGAPAPAPAAQQTAAWTAPPSWNVQPTPSTSAQVLPPNPQAEAAAACATQPVWVTAQGPAAPVIATQPKGHATAQQMSTSSAQTPQPLGQSQQAPGIAPHQVTSSTSMADLGLPSLTPSAAVLLPVYAHPQPLAPAEATVVTLPQLHVPPAAASTMPPASAAQPHAQPLHVQQQSSQEAWDAFQALRQQLNEGHQRTLSLHAQISQLQLTHEKEASIFRDAANAQIEQQRKALETTTEHYNEAQSKIESLSNLLSRKAEHIVKIEQKLHEATVGIASMTQKVVHMEDRVRLSDSARQVAEVRVRELELTLEHSAQLVDTLRRQLSGSHDDKIRALQQQHEIAEKNRQDLIYFYNGREQQLVQNYNSSLKQLQVIMEDRMAGREQAIARHWEDVMAEVRRQHERIQRDIVVLKEDASREVQDFRSKMYAERDAAEARQAQEIALLEQRHREREDHVLADIARRERELAEREQKFRIQRAQDEQDAKISLLAKEAELKAYYEKIMDDLRRGHEQDREKLCSAFRDQVQQLSSNHLNNERELERLHREKEREMAQRYRIAGYENEDRKGQFDLQDVATRTQGALLSKLDTIENRQRERADQTRSAMRASTSLSGIGVASTNIGSASSAASPDT